MLPTQLMMRGLIVHCKGGKLIKNQTEVNINQICWYLVLRLGNTSTFKADSK